MRPWIVYCLLYQTDRLWWRRRRLARLEGLTRYHALVNWNEDAVGKHGACGEIHAVREDSGGRYSGPARYQLCRSVTGRPLLLPLATLRWLFRPSVR